MCECVWVCMWCYGCVEWVRECICVVCVCMYSVCIVCVCACVCVCVFVWCKFACCQQPTFLFLSLWKTFQRAGNCTRQQNFSGLFHFNELLLLQLQPLACIARNSITWLLFSDLKFFHRTCNSFKIFILSTYLTILVLYMPVYHCVFSVICFT